MEIKIKIDDLKQILMESYKKGWHGSLDLNEENADAIVERYVDHEEPLEHHQLVFTDISSQWNNVSVTVDGVPTMGVDPADRSTWTIGAGE